MFKYYLYKFGQFLVTRLPLKLSYRVGIFFSDLQFAFSRLDRISVCNNLKNILSSSEDISSQAREVFRNFGRYLVEFFRVGEALDSQFIEKNVRIVNREYVDETLRKGRGGIITTAHIGNWELGAIVLGMLRYPIVAVALPHKERPVNDLFNKQREGKGVTVVPVAHAVRRCLESLKENKLIGVVADRDFSAHGIVMDFLGRKALIPKGAAIFAFKTGAPVIPTFMIREADGTFTLTFEKPIYPPQVIDGHVGEAELTEFIRKYLVYIENCIRNYPTQWLMMREFWIK